MHAAAQDIFRQLQERAKGKIENVWNDPAKRAKMPGVAASCSGEQITIGELAEECIARHGPETLEGMISRKILEQACQKQGINVTEQDIDQEIAAGRGDRRQVEAATARPTWRPGWNWSRRSRAFPWTSIATTSSGPRSP